jgi:hypothetical protein
LVSIELVVDTFHFANHVQVHPIANLVGDFVETGHEALEIFHIG